MRLTSGQNGLYGLKGLEKKEKSDTQGKTLRLVPGPQYYLITRTDSKLCAETLPQAYGGKKCAWVVF